MRYAVARLNKQLRESAYRIYVTDALYALLNGGRFGMTMTRRYADIFETERPKSKTEQMTQEEIVDKIWSNIGG